MRILYSPTKSSCKPWKESNEKGYSYNLSYKMNYHVERSVFTDYKESLDLKIQF